LPNFFFEKFETLKKWLNHILVHSVISRKFLLRKNQDVSKELYRFEKAVEREYLISEKSLCPALFDFRIITSNFYFKELLAKKSYRMRKKNYEKNKVKNAL